MNKIVWIFNQFAVSPNMPGPTRHYNIAKELIKNGYDVFIFASDYSFQELTYKKLRPTESYKIEIIDKVKFVWIRVPSYKKNNYKRLINQIMFAIRASIISRRLCKPDIIIGSSPQLFTAISALITSKLRRVKFIGEIRDLWPESLLELHKSFKYNPYIFVLYMLAIIIYRKSRNIIILAHGNKQKIIEKGIPESKIHYIPNGIDTNRKVNTANAQKIKQKYNINKFTICYTGSIGIANNLEMIMDVAKNIDNNAIEIIIFGDGPMKKSLNSIISNLGLKNVRIEEMVSNNEIYDLLSNVDVCFITLQDVPLFKYGVSPNKLFDYMYAKKPIICSVGGWCNNVIQKAKCGIAINPDNADEFIKAINSLYKMNTSEREKLGFNGYDYVKTHFSRQETTKKLIKIIK